MNAESRPARPGATTRCPERGDRHDILRRRRSGCHSLETALPARRGTRRDAHDGLDEPPAIFGRRERLEPQGFPAPRFGTRRRWRRPAPARRTSDDDEAAADTRAAMLFDNESRVVRDHDRGLRLIMEDVLGLA